MIRRSSGVFSSRAFGVLAVVTQLTLGCNGGDGRAGGGDPHHEQKSGQWLSVHRFRVPINTNNVRRREEALGFSAPNQDLQHARNVVLMIGDGMGLGALSTASYVIHGPEGGLAVESAPVVGLVKTHALDSLVTDSAAAASAMATGHKVDRETISVIEGEPPPPTIIELAMASGMKTGVITTSYLADATVAAFLCHSASRRQVFAMWERVFSATVNIMVGGDGVGVFGDSESNALVRQHVDALAASAVEDRRTVVRDQAAFFSITSGDLIGLFPQRQESDLAFGPPLDETTEHVLELLSLGGGDFFLLIETEEPDVAGHEQNSERLVQGICEFDRAVQVVLDFAARRGDTLVLVTSDHATGGPTIDEGVPVEDRIHVSWVNGEHSADWVPLFAFGPGSGIFGGVLDNTEVFELIGCVLALDE